MKKRIIVSIFLVILSARLSAQPPENIYLGNTVVSGYTDDASYGPFNIGFNFSFFGNSYNQFYINSNGQVLFGAGSLESSDASIPTASAPNNFIAPFWDDLVVDSYGKILYTTIGVSPNRKLIIQFTNMGFYPFPTTLGTFSVILFETSNIIQIQYRMIVLTYSGKAHGSTATIGLENATGTSGIQYAFHNAGAISNNQAISFSPVAGPSYSVNSNAVYDGVYLTTNLTLPDPGITSLASPPLDAIVGSDVTFEWSNTPNAASYILYIGADPELVGASSYQVGANLSYNVTGLNPNQTYYWAVFSRNATGTTWCEVKRFTTSSTPPLAAVPLTVWTEQPVDKTVKLLYTGGNAGSKTAIITSLPSQGQLWQYSSGARGNLISSVPVTVTDADMNLIYAASGNAGNGAGNFNFKIHDSSGDSPEATVTVNVSPPGVPNILYISRGANIEIQADIPMTDPAGKQNQFIVKVNGTSVPIISASLKSGDPNTIVLTLASPLTGAETVLVSYTAGDVSSVKGGWLASFTDQNITLLSQTMTFATDLTKTYGDPPFLLSASSSSGLGITYSSSNLPVATIVNATLSINSAGSSDIIARQAGNSTWAPAKFIKSLSVAKGNQTITFSPLLPKTYGDADFTVTATSSIGSTVSFASDNPAVAIITAAGVVHITGAGTAVITALQSGNENYNAATPVLQTLTVSKATLTFTADNKTKDYLAQNPTLTYQITGFVNGETQSVLDVLPAIQTNCLQNSPAGIYIVSFSGGSDNNYSYAFIAGRLTVNKIPQTITFTNIPEKLLMSETYTLSATSTSGLSVLFASSDDSKATVAGNLLTGVSRGVVQIRAYNEGDQNYYPAETIASVEIYSTHKDIMHLFTPNNDGFNDYWELPDMPSWGKCDAKVYNRWGKLVFSDANYNNLWDGTSDGNPLPEGAYYFVIKTENSGTIKGTVNIVR